MLKLEQKKENIYQISHQKIVSVLCELGGLIYFLSILISPICSFYSQAKLSLDLINNYFSLQEMKHQVKSSTEKEKTVTSPNNGQALIESASEEKVFCRAQIISHFSQIPKKESLRTYSIHDNKVKSILKQKDSQQISDQSVSIPSDKSNHLFQWIVIYEGKFLLVKEKFYIEKNPLQLIYPIKH